MPPKLRDKILHAYRNLEKRLLNEDIAQRKISAKKEDSDFPDWILKIDFFKDRFEPLKDARFTNENKLPFEEILAFIVAEARKDTLETDLLSKKAKSSLERSLLNEIVFISQKTIFVEFKTYKAQREKHGKNSNHYCSFLNDFKSLIPEILRRYPIMAAYIFRRVEMWENSTEEFICRLNKDKSQIEEWLGIDELRITDIDTDTGDSHGKFRQVMVLTDKTGRKFVYKPRPSRFYKPYSGFCEWIENNQEDVLIGVPKSVLKDNYAWVEHISASPPSDSNNGRFYRNVGATLAVAYLLDAGDIHQENIIFDSSKTYIIDLETLLYPLKVNKKYSSNYSPQKRVMINYLDSSILKTSMLPFSTEKTNNRDFSPLAQLNNKPNSEKLVWKKINTDNMDFKYEKIEKESSKYTNMQKEDIKDVEKGLKRVLKLVDKQNLPQKLIDEFKDLKLRYVAKPTSIYNSILQDMMNPSNLKHAEAQAKCINKIEDYAKFIGQDGYSFKKMSRKEKRSLLNLDIPKFERKTHLSDLYWKDEKILENFFHKSGVEELKSNINDPEGEKTVNQTLASLRTSLDQK